MASSQFRMPALSEQQILDTVQIRLVPLDDPLERERFRELMEKHHYLKSDILVGEQLRYVAEVNGQWLALLSWSAAANHLKDREKWIAWDISQRRRRLALVANNARFLILPGTDCPNLASRVLALCCARLADDWQQTYGHPVLVAESFVDSQLFRGTCYKAQGWQLLGETQGNGRSRQDYYTAHGRPKQLWVRELCPNACKLLASAQLPEDLRHVEDAVIPRCNATAGELRKLIILCRRVPEWRARKGRDYSLPCLLAIMVMATLSGIVRGQRDLAAFAAKLTQFQLRTLGSYRKRSGAWDFPKETTFQRVLANLDAEAFESIIIEWEIQRAAAALGGGPADEDDQVAIDGKAQRGSTPHVADEQKAQLVSAQSQPSGRVLGTVAVEHKSNEIPAARALLEKLGPLDGKLLMLDALHTCQQTMRQVHQDNGADFLLPVKDNHPELAARAAACLPDRSPAVIPPLGGNDGLCLQHGTRPRARHRTPRAHPPLLGHRGWPAPAARCEWRGGCKPGAQSQCHPCAGHPSSQRRGNLLPVEKTSQKPPAIHLQGLSRRDE